MEIILNGANGRMGRILTEQLAAEPDGLRLAARVDPALAPDEANGTYAALEQYAGPADVLVDFSSHLATDEILDYCLRRGLAAVIAPTGQTGAELDRIRGAAKEIPIFLSANMSIGVAVLADLARRAAAAFPDADIEIIERHHNQKLDVPSGTALLLARRIREARPEAEFLVGRHENGKRTKREIGIHSLRYGNEVGTHEIIISTGRETLTLKHEAENRALFADGALAAARFLCGKAPGLYDMQDMLA